MLNIRINFSIDLKKSAVKLATLLIFFSHLVVPPTAEALVVPPAPEKPITELVKAAFRVDNLMVNVPPENAWFLNTCVDWYEPLLILLIYG